MNMNLSQALERFSKNDDNKGHYDRVFLSSIQQYESDIKTTEFFLADIIERVGFKGGRVLEVGSSIGATSFALACREDVTSIVAIEPEVDAVNVALLYKTHVSDKKITFINSTLEDYNYDENKFDFIICNTVLEHVDDVERCLEIMINALSEHGILYISAPNYTWIHEPHLNLWSPKLNPSKSIFWMVAKLTKKDTKFLEHLNLIKAKDIVESCEMRGVIVENLALKKAEDIIYRANMKGVVKYKRLARILSSLKLSKMLFNMIKKYHLYPSIEIKVTKTKESS